MAEIAGLAASMAALIVEKQVEGKPITPELFRHLVRAAQILLDNGVPWPPSVELVVSEVGRRVVARHGES
jgi:hypothetical protein